MKTIDYRFNLDLHVEGAQVIRNVQRGDTAARLIVTFSEEGKPYPLDSMGENKVIAFVAAKADGTYFYDDHVEIDAEANAVVITLPQQATAAAGIALCQFKLIDGGQIKASPMFSLNVTSNPYDEQEISPSSTDFLRLTNLIAEIESKLENHEFDGEQGPKGDKGDKGDSGTGIVSTNSFDNSVDPNLIYKVNRSGAQYLMFVIRSSTAITQWRYQPKDASNNQTANIEVRYGTVRTAGGNEIVDFGSNQWVPLTDVLNLCTNTGADTKIAAAVSGKANAATTLAGYGITDGMKLTVETTGTTIPTTLNQGQFYTNGGKVFLKNNESFKVANHLQLAAIGDIPTKTSDLTNDSGFLTSHQDISGKEDSANKVEVVQSSTSKSQYPSVNAMTAYVTNALSGKENAANKVTSLSSGSTNTQYPSAKAVYDQLMLKANLEDVPEYLRDLTDGNKAIIKYEASSAPPTAVTSEPYTVPCLWEYNGDLWYVYKDTGTGGRHLYSSIPLTEDIPTNVSAFINDAGYLTAHQDISGKMNLAPSVSPNDIANVTEGQLFRSTGGIALKESSGYTELAKKSDIPTVPSNVSAFQNDAGYLTLATLPIYNGGVQ